MDEAAACPDLSDRGVPRLLRTSETRHFVMNSHAQAAQTIPVTLTVMGDATAVIAVLETGRMSNFTVSITVAQSATNSRSHSTQWISVRFMWAQPFTMQ